MELFHDLSRAWGGIERPRGGQTTSYKASKGQENAFIWVSTKIVFELAFLPAGPPCDAHVTVEAGV